MTTQTRTHGPSRARRAVLVLAAAALALPLAGCDQWSATCETDSSCHIEITGTKFNEMPRPLEADEGIEKDGAPDRIRLLEAAAGGSATIQVGGGEQVCAQGESFTVMDTTFTCTEVGDESVVLDTVRG